jgi:hypothetical protein
MVDSFGRSKGDNGSLKVKHFKWFKLLFLNHIKISFSLSKSLNSGKLVREDTNQGMKDINKSVFGQPCHLLKKNFPVK